MNYNVLRYFSVLAQVEHYTLAAARLGISQPTLSSAIHNLENELGGVKLFEKVGRNIRLTEEGRFYREKVDTALNLRLVRLLEIVGIDVCGDAEILISFHCISSLEYNLLFITYHDLCRKSIALRKLRKFPHKKAPCIGRVLIRK